MKAVFHLHRRLTIVTKQQQQQQLRRRFRLSPTSQISYQRNNTIKMGSATTNDDDGPTDALAGLSLHDFCASLSSKQPTPGGGASAAVGAAVGAGAAAMAGAYTQRKKDEESGAADAARTMIAKMDVPTLLSMADDDVRAYRSLQGTWKKDSGLTQEQIDDIQANALKVPTVLVEACHERIVAVQDFLPSCNPNITSDAKVGIHQLAGTWTVTLTNG
jgi:formiminotetrahydrofolate cyclodeaminase